MMQIPQGYVPKVMKRRGLFYAHVLRALLHNEGVTAGQIKPVGRGARHLSLGLELGNPKHLRKAVNLTEPLALAAKVENVLANRHGGLIVYQFELTRQYWKTYTRQDIAALSLPPATVGIDERKMGIAFDFNRQPHALFAGTSGSGKSEAIKSTLIGLTDTYTPAELGLIIIDPKLDYKSDFDNLAHLVYPVCTDAAEIEAALTWLNTELAHRKRNNFTDGKIIVCVIDEADDHAALKVERNREAVRMVSKQGRAFGLHLIIGTQKPNHTDLPDILDNLLNRFVGQVSDAGLSAKLTGHGGLLAHKLTGKGDFLHVIAPDVERFQVAMATRRDYETLPRADITPPSVVAACGELASPDLVILPDDEPDKGGRPQNTIEPATLAYVAHCPKVSVRDARSDGISYEKLKMHKDFWRQFLAEFKRLREATR